MPLLRDRAQMLIKTQVCELVVVLPDGLASRRDALNGLELLTVTNARAKSGMASSIQTGLDALPVRCDAALIMPADLPDLTTQDIDQMLEARDAAPDLIHRATSDAGIPGSPVIFPCAFFAELQGLEGDESGRKVLARHKDRIREHALPHDHATLDLDTPEAWATWRNRSV